MIKRRSAAAPQKKPRPSLHAKRRIALLGSVLVVATVALYYPVISHPFSIFDDDVYVTGNSHVKSGLHWETIKWAAITYDACNWHPVTWLSHAADCQFFGLDASDHHGTNLLLHALNALLLFFVLVRATSATGASFVVAALFAMHPMNVESVAWIAERKNLLSMLLFLLALGAYGWYVRKPKVGRYALVALLYALALMAKPQVITFPFVLLLWDYWPLERIAFRQNVSSSRSGEERNAKSEAPWLWLILEKLPLVALSATSAVITMKAQLASGAIRWFPFSLRVQNAIVAYALYVKKAFWPSRLAIIYPHPTQGIPGRQVFLALLFLLAVTALVIKERRRRYLLVGWFWFLGTLVPMIGLVQVGEQAMADRYAYLSFVGLFITVCWGVKELAAQYISDRWLAGASAAVLLALATVTHHQLNYWSDNVALWSHTLEITGNNWLAENNLGAALLGEGRQEDAIEHFRRSEAIYPNDPVSHLDIGYYDQQHADLAAAMAEYNKVIALAPKEKVRIAAEAYNNIGYGYLSLKNLPLARSAFESAVGLNPQHNRAWIGLGVTAQKTGDLDHAIDDYSRSLQAEPSDIGYLLLAQALRRRGDAAGAQRATEQAHSISNNFAQAQHIAERFVSN